MSPFAENPIAYSEPEYLLPPCYTLTGSLPLPKMSLFTDETLFYIFYAFARDAAQEAAAQELYERSWRYHKELKLWLCKDPSSLDQSVKGPGCERGVYIFFDPSSWSRVKKEWILYYDQLEERGSWDHEGSSGGNGNGSLANTDLQNRKLGEKGQSSSTSGKPIEFSNSNSNWNELLSSKVGQVAAGR